MQREQSAHFAFEYVGLTTRDMGCGRWVHEHATQWAVFGRLLSGRIGLGQAVLLPTADGDWACGYIARFADSLSEWLGMPFYDWVSIENMPHAFCLCVGGLSSSLDLLCPGIARSERPNGSPAAA
jgi:hypothetical protein